MGDYMIKKIRPKTEIKLNYGMDGRDAYYEIAYFCPTCGKSIYGYKVSNACDRCGTFYDWSGKEPRIVVHRSVEW